MGVEMYFTGKLKERLVDILTKEAGDSMAVEEVRLRVNKEVMVKCSKGMFYLGQAGKLSSDEKDGIICRKEDIDRSLELMSDYSLYAFNEEIRNGFITLPGGHRVGVCGQAVWDEDGIKTIKNICFMNVRIARECKGCASKFMNFLYDAEGHFVSTLILSPAGYGKTTILRDIIRNVSNNGINVSVIDERSELAACYKGVPQNDVGICTDVLDMAPKSKGIIMMLRAMAPEVIAVDEINATEDMKAIQTSRACGAALLCTAHGDCRIWENSLTKEGIFDRYVYIEKPRHYKLFDKEKRLIWEVSDAD